MPDKRRKLSYFDLPVLDKVGAAGTNSVDNVAAGVAITVGPPIDVALTSGVVYASAAPQSYVELTWSPPETSSGATPDRYTVQVSTDSTFTASGTITAAIAPANRDAPSARVDGLPPNTLHYVRLRAIVNGYPGAWSSMSPLTTGVNRITTAQDTTAAGVPTSITATWIGYGDLLVTWTEPADANLKDVQVVVRASSGGTVYRTAYSAASRFLYTLAMNYNDTAGAGDSSLYVELRSRTFSNVFGTTVNTGLVTKAAPATPAGLTQTWSGDAGTAGADLSFAWTRAEDAYRYRLTLDSVNRQLSGNADTYTYTYALNRSEHAGTADAVISYSLVAVDGFGQVSTASSGTATNAAPAAPSAVGVSGFFSSFAIAITATPPADFSYYQVRIIQTSPSAADVTFRTATTLVQRAVSTAATYQVGVKVVDVFGQASSETLSSTTTLDSLTLSDLRSRIVYSDSEATAAATLKAALADDNKTSGGISYASNAGWVRSIRSDWQLQERIKTVTLSMTPASGTTNWYVRTSTDGSTWSYYSGPVTSSRILTAVADASAAQAAAVSAATLGGSTTSRVDLPALTEARYVEVWLRNTSASTRVDEFYPRRLTQSDDIEAESIRAINIAAGSITADRLSVSQLSAITADMGSITAGTITGATIRSAASGARWEGNTTHLFGTDGSTTQWEVLNSTGKLTAGAGNVILDASGITITCGSAGFNTIKWTASGVEKGIIYGQYAGGSGAEVHLESDGNVSGEWNKVFVQAQDVSATVQSLLYLFSQKGSSSLSEARLQINSAAELSATPGAVKVYNGLNVGTATGAATGAIKASSDLYIGVGGAGSVVSDDGTAVLNLHSLRTNIIANTTATTAGQPTLSTFTRSSGTVAATFGAQWVANLETDNGTDRNALLMQTTWQTATDASRKARAQFFVYDTAPREAFRIEAGGTQAGISFFGGAINGKQAVTGVRTGTLAQLQTVVANMLTALANYNLWTDSTT